MGNQYSFEELNKDQLDGLSKLCFDLAKGSFAFVLFQTAEGTPSLIQAIMKIITSTLIGLVFTYIALILLMEKEENLK